MDKKIEFIESDIVTRLRGVEEVGIYKSGSTVYAYPDVCIDAANEIERLRGSFAKSLIALAKCLECLEQNTEDPDTVAIGILREAMYGGTSEKGDS